MELTKLINSVHAIQVAGDLQRREISGIYHDSRRVKPNSVFVAIKGYTVDGHRFILDAINNGAEVIVLEDQQALPEQMVPRENIVKVVVKDSRIALAELSRALHRNPDHDLDMVGLTGTKGKTTTTYIIKSIFETAGKKTGLMGSIASYIGDEMIPSELTTPESSDVYELLRKMLLHDCKNAVMEVSSHSLILKRVFGLRYKGALFTNITSDHLDFHKTFEEYRDAKKILFDELNDDAVAVFNADDESSAYLMKDTKAKTSTYGVAETSDYQMSDIIYDLNGTQVKVHYDGKVYELRTGLLGAFNAYNMTAAFAVTTQMGIDPDIAVKGIKKTKQVPGRFQVVGKGDKKVVVDYSHTSDSLEKILQSIRSIVGDEHPVHTVMGCGGDRDTTKRPIMGNIAATYSSQVIVTNDNPRTEDPMKIIDQITEGIKKDNYIVEPDREAAIKKAIEESEVNAVVLISGKGHEDYQIIGKTKHHFSDVEIAEKYLK